jgi:nucleotide-binding universal stress UspA family protein
MTSPCTDIRRIVVAIDGSEGALHAAEHAVDLAAALGGDVVFVYVIDDQVSRALEVAFPGDERSGAERLEADANGRLDQPAEQARRRGCAFSKRIERGDPVERLEAVANEVGADLIVVGRTGCRGARRVLLGSVARRLTESSRVPVLVIGERRKTRAAGKH